MRDYINTRSISGIDELKIDVNRDKPGMQVLVDRKKAGELGVTTRFTDLCLIALKPELFF